MSQLENNGMDPESGEQTPAFETTENAAPEENTAKPDAEAVREDAPAEKPKSQPKRDSKGRFIKSE